MDIGALVNNQYQVIEHIGRGGMADVWSARDKRLRRMVAIKTIAPGLGSDVDPVSLFEREAHTIAQMEHPHILPIYDFGEYDSGLYIVMRFVTGGSLEDIVREGPLAPDEVLRMGDAIGSALDYAHENNVIHLDLKPPNILLDSSRSPYLADFGLATVLDPEGRARNPGSGTLLYMAPEQFVAEMIDHRADIYSFTIMLFHMLTGRLPFDGAAPLAMRQMQRGEEIPYIDEYVSSLPSELTDILRLGTSQDPNFRPSQHMELMEQFRAIIRPTAVDMMIDIPQDDYGIEADPYNLLTEQDLDISDSGLLEAVDIFSRAVYDWQGGQGRFLMGVTHFMLMCEYYQNTEKYNLNIDENGFQMLLRGALEYDYELDYWWKRVDNDGRRWVCLHALRSGNAPARIRALYRLETLPDKETQPVIPKLVAQALEIETDNTAKKAALKVLATRSRLVKHKQVDIMTEYRGRVLSTMTRLGIQIREPAFWQNYIYSPEVDLLIAEEAFDPSPDVAEYAARTVGQMRSLAAVTHLAEEQRNGRRGALDALAFVRDEAPELPKEVSRDARFYAWVTNTIRRMTDNPLDSILRFVLAFIGGWVGMGDQIYTLFNSGSLFSLQRWANVLGMGLIFAMIVAITFYLTDEISRRLQGFWSWWMRLALTGILGYIMATLLFASVRGLFYNDPQIAWDYMRFLGASFAFGLVGTSLLRVRGWRGVLLTTLVLFVPIYASYHIFYTEAIGSEFAIILLAPLALAIGIFCGWRAAQLSIFRFALPIGKITGLFFAIILGLFWAGGTWLYFEYLLTQYTNQIMTWDTLLLILAFMLILGIAISYWLPAVGRLSFGLTAIIAFALLYVWKGWHFFSYSYTMPFTFPALTVKYYDGTGLIPSVSDAMFEYFPIPDNLDNIFTVTLPMIFVVALGVNLQPLIESWMDWIGKPKSGKERGGWLGIMLLYVMAMSGMVAVLSLFSGHTSAIWALLWSIWGTITFILALATYRWAKWGADGLLWSAIFLVLAGFFFDYVNMRYMASQGQWPAYLQVVPITIQFLGIQFTFTASQIHFWGLWSVPLGVFAWGAMRRALWAGIGLIVMLIGWILVAMFSPLQGSVAIFAMTNVALLAYCLAPKLELMEAGRFEMPHLRPLPPPPEASPAQKMLTELHRAGSGDILPTEVMTMPLAKTDELVPPTKLIADAKDKSEEVHPNMMTEYDPQSEIYDEEVKLGDEEERVKHQVDTVPYYGQKPKLTDSDVKADRQDELDTDPKIQLTQPGELLDDVDTDKIQTVPKVPKVDKQEADTEPKIRFDKGDLHDKRTVRYDRHETGKDDKKDDE